MGMASSRSEASYIAELHAAVITPLGWIRNASNQTLLVTLDGDEDRLAVYKPDAGERPLHDFPYGTLARREVAAFVLSDWLGWDLVPATIYRDGPEGPGSLQRYVPHAPARHYFVLAAEGIHDAALTRLALFDLLVNNADRKASHVMLGEEGLRGCDHGLCFHSQPKVRTVIWEFAGMPIALDDRADLQRLAESLADGAALDAPKLALLLEAAEIAALQERARELARCECLPDPPQDRRPYPWPLL